MLYLCAIATLLCSTAGAATSGELLQQALYAEEIEGDLPAAIASYEKIIDNAEAPPNHVAQALYRKGMCYLTLKDETNAAIALTRLVNNFSDQASLVEKARPTLEKLRVFDPASLMPADTLAYIELGSPGKQVESLLNMLEISSMEDPFMALKRAQNGIPSDSAEAALFQFFNPSMLAEMKKVRSLAVGSVEINPPGQPSFVCVMHPGESDALRGMVIAGLSMAGKPSGQIEGMTVLRIPDGPSMAYDDKVILIAHPRERLVACIDQYKGISSEPSLASGNPTFRKIDKFARKRNAATLWVDVDTLYDHLLQQQPGLPPKVRMTAGMLGVSGIDDLLLTHAIHADGIELNAMVNFKEGVPNMAYELVKTPTLESSGLAGVPPEAFFIASMALSSNNAAQIQQLQSLIAMATGSPCPPGFLENIEQVSLFALPGEAESPEGMPFRPGIVLTCRQAEPVVGPMQQLLQQIPDMPPGIIVQADQHTGLLSLEESVELASYEATQPGKSVLDGGTLKGAVQSNVVKSEKMILINAGGLVRLAGIQVADDSGVDAETTGKLTVAFDELAKALDSTTLSICSDEQPGTLSLQAKVSDVPPLSQLVAPITELARLNEEVEQQQAEAEARERAAKLAELTNQPPARIVDAATAPAIDGEIDDVWDAAENYELTKTIYENAGPENQIAASYRMLWDADKLYVLIDVTDSSSGYNPDQIWQFNDGIELYLNATGNNAAGYSDTDYQFGLLWRENEAEALCVQERGRPVHAIEAAMKNTDKGYRFELALPLSELGTTAAAGAHIGVEVQVNDNRGWGGRDAKISWHDPYDQAWLNPQYFGRAELVRGME